MAISPSKPALPNPDDPSFGTQVKTMLEILTGRRGNKIAKLFPKLNTSVAAPTKAEFDVVCAQVETLQEKINELISRFDT